MAIEVHGRTSASPQRAYLAPAVAADAEPIASWIDGALDTYWLAPRTAPPITTPKIAHWIAAAGKRGRSLFADELHVGYGELNDMRSRRNQHWLGHLIVNPARRGERLGLRLTELLLAEAFDQLRSNRVSLVVFTDNEPAVACYHAAGMSDDGWETHEFPPYHRTARLLRMAITRRAWLRR